MSQPDDNILKGLEKVVFITIEQTIVEQGGGIYVGRMEHLVLFNSPTTDSTLCLRENDLTVENVRKQIEESDARFAAGRLRATLSLYQQ